MTHHEVKHPSDKKTKKRKIHTKDLKKISGGSVANSVDSVGHILKASISKT